MYFSPEVHAQSILPAWVELAKERTKSERVRTMDFDRTPMSLPLVSILEKMVAAQESILSSAVYEQLKIILQIHQQDFLTQQTNKYALFSGAVAPLPLPADKSTHQDPYAGQNHTLIK